jgi:BirA family transcriptional regulator, biotin operon repressor / biotin---[acetyl-CoA-carboxylase] ligase
MLSVKTLHLDTVASTMESARDLLKDADVGLITAKRQTRGRGTQSREWVSPVGNLYMTFALRLSFIASERLQTVSLEAGLLLFQTLLSGMRPESEKHLWIKWPNDILWDGTKVAGLLIEISGSHILIGAGINLDSPPQLQDGGRPTAGLASQGWNGSRAIELAERYTQALHAKLIQFWSEKDRENLIQIWSGHTRWNEPIRLRDRENASMAQPLRLDSQGHLWVKLEAGQEEKLIAEYLW